MPNYIYFQHDQKRLFDRFPADSGIIGVSDWREYNGNPHKLLNILSEYKRPVPASSCPRLFISHRQVDDHYALRIAQLAAHCKFEFWVDVLDPSLRSLDGNRNYTKEEISVLTACIIEMALINCTHVITIMSPNTRGSLWVPYEYGRITGASGDYDNACAWRHPSLLKEDLPEYMDLGIVTSSEAGIKHWLNAEYSSWIKKGSIGICNAVWNHGDQQELPD
ncbi:TIR domain-containing protein [Chitinophaga tropicalis]|uniref:TIR domain-containing protein n=1 Tax=Chitinophaga tropicalis TaxID=2683588 RepID=A0A7K1U6N3_9BACT|nr:hypothetical protein [Chitinophaga tropicalis]MVT10000.1 hypothetical protein [Chitinophaga tropicalis]